MKLLHLPLNVPGSEQVGQERGFREVFDTVLTYDYLKEQGDGGKNAANEKLIATIKEFQPDILWAQLQETDCITPKTWETIRNEFPSLWMTTWSGDARTYVPTGMQQWLPNFDIFYNDTDQKELYQPHCKRYEFMPIAVDPIEATDYSHPTPNIPEAIFIGNNYNDVFTNGGYRKELMMALTREFGNKFGVFGTGWDQSEVNVLGSCPVKHQGAYYHKAKVVISVDHIKGILHWSERLVWALASGTPVIMETQPEVRRYFADRVKYFNNINQAVHHINTILDKPYRCEDNVKFILERHTWTQRAKTVLEDYERR